MKNEFRDWKVDRKENRRSWLKPVILCIILAVVVLLVASGTLNVNDLLNTTANATNVTA